MGVVDTLRTLFLRKEILTRPVSRNDTNQRGGPPRHRELLTLIVKTVVYRPENLRHSANHTVRERDSELKE